MDQSVGREEARAPRRFEVHWIALRGRLFVRIECRTLFLRALLTVT